VESTARPRVRLTRKHALAIRHFEPFITARRNVEQAASRVGAPTLLRPTGASNRLNNFYNNGGGTPPRFVSARA
jgi:hypothetical protein